MTVSELVALLQAFDGSLKVDGADGLSVEVVTLEKVVKPAPVPAEASAEVPA